MTDPRRACEGLDLGSVWLSEPSIDQALLTCRAGTDVVAIAQFTLAR